jgi:hypothetical protein
MLNKDMSSQYVINSPLFLNTIQNGVVIPRLTTSQKFGIPGPVAGTLVYDNTLNDFQFFNGTSWVSSGYSATGGNYVDTLTDAFGRLRTSNPFTLFDSYYRYKDNGDFDTALVGLDSTGAVNSATSIYEMSLENINSSVTRQSYYVFPYQPGKSLLIMCSFVASSNSYTAVGMTQDVGYCSDLNGVFVRVQDGIVYMCIKNDGVVTSAAQSSWNVDQLTGTGPSGLTLDITKSQIFFTALEWLGVGTVSVGFVINGQFTTVHKFNHANLTTSTYMTTATLPVRYQISTTAGYSSGTSMLKQICCTVISEGGYQAISQKYYVNLGTSLVTVSTTLIPLISIRIRSDRLDSIVIPASVEMVVTTNNVVQYQLLLNGTLTGGSWVQKGGTSNVEYNTTATAISGGTLIDTGYISSSNQAKNALTSSGAIEFNTQIPHFLNGTSGIITICAISFTANASVSAALGWYELD